VYEVAVYVGGFHAIHELLIACFYNLLQESTRYECDYAMLRGLCSLDTQRPRPFP